MLNYLTMKTFHHNHCKNSVKNVKIKTNPLIFVATIEVSYPIRLKKSKHKVYMKLGEEDLDVILDIPDLSHFDMSSEVEGQISALSSFSFLCIGGENN